MEFITKSYSSDLLPQILILWNSDEFGVKYPLTEALWQQQIERDPNFQPEDFIGAFEAEKLIGFVIAKQFRDAVANPDMAYYTEMGWIAAIVVGEQWRRQGIGSQLVKLGEARLKAANLPQVLVGGNFRHFFPALPLDLPYLVNFFQKQGYAFRPEGDRVHDLRRSLTDYDLPFSYKDSEFYFTQGQKGEEAAIVAFLARSFPGRWRYTVDLWFRQGANPQDMTLLKRSSDNSIQGFLQTGHKNSPIIANALFWYRLFDEDYGGIGPLGVSSEVRGKGLGLALVEAGVAYLQSLGVKDCAIDWTNLTEFYGKLGFKIWKSYDRFSKKF